MNENCSHFDGGVSLVVHGMCIACGGHVTIYEGKDGVPLVLGDIVKIPEGLHGVFLCVSELFAGECTVRTIPRDVVARISTLVLVDDAEAVRRREPGWRHAELAREHECTNTGTPICPWCGYPMKDAHEFGGIYDEAVVVCDACERRYHISVRVERAFTTRRAGT